MKKSSIITKSALIGLLSPLNVLICLVLICALFLSGNYVRSAVLFDTEQLKTKDGEHIDEGEKVTAGDEVFVAKQGNLEMFVNTKNLNIKIRDTESGREFNTLSERTGLASEGYSPVVVSYLNEKDTIVEWNGYDYCIKNNDYEVYKINNGVRLKMNFSSGASYVVTDYLPKKISEKRYIECFEDKLNELLEDGKISSADKSRYISILGKIYKKEADGNYVFRSSNNPLKSVMTIVVDLVGVVGYTQDDILADSAEFDIKVELSSSVKLTVCIDNYFENGQFVVNVPMSLSTINNSDCSIQNIKLYPAFDSRDNANEQGYIFVPDGAGLLIPFNSFNPETPTYKRAVFDNNLYQTYSEKDNCNEKLYMPVFGFYDIKDEKNGKGFMAVIESGAQTAYVNTSLKDVTSGESSTSYNAVFASFDTVQYTTVNILGYYAEKSSKYISKTPQTDIDIKVRYFLYPRGVDYSAFAMDYRDYLSGGEKLNFNNSAELYINVLGSLSVTANIIGFDYDKTVTLTNYSQLAEIYDEMSEKSQARFCYRWVFNGGKNNNVFNRASTIKNAGSEKELLNIINKSKKVNNFFVEANLMRVYDESGAFDSSMHSLYGFDDGKFAFSDSRYTDGTLMSGIRYETSYLLSPKYLSDSIKRFLKDSSTYKNLYITDMGSTYYADYKKDDYISPYAADEVVKQNLKEIKKDHTIALDNPNSDRTALCDIAIGISRESSGFGGSKYTIPFRQLALNGICDFTTLNVNMSENSSDYYLLQALELGAIPMFTVSASEVYDIMEKGVSDYFSVYYKDILPVAVKLYQDYADAFEKIKTKEISSHELISDGVFKTNYANGVSVVVNYHDYDVSTPYGKLNGMDYLIFGGE